MLQTTLVLLFNDQGQILLAMKKRGFGVGKWNGAGGKIHEGETVIQGGLRELEEEVGVQLEESEAIYKGFLAFRYKDSGEKNDTDCSVFTAKYNGEVYESEEMMPRWFDVEDIPFDEMRPDDKVWLPELLKGAENFRYEFIFSSLDDKTPQIKRIQ